VTGETHLRPAPAPGPELASAVGELQRAQEHQPSSDKWRVNKVQVDALTFARHALDLPTLRRVVQRAREDALYDLEMEDGTLVPIGSISQLADPRRVDEAIAGQLGFMPDAHYSRPQFKPVINALLAIAELEDGGATPGNLTRVWVARFAGERAVGRVFNLTDPEARSTILDETWQAFRGSDERLYLHGPAFLEFVRGALRERIEPKETYARLARLGFDQYQVAEQRTSRDSRPRKRRYLRSPADFTPEDDE
jgi:hypothetical protein